MSLAGLAGSPNVQRLWRNTRAAYKDWDASADPARPTVHDLREWHVSADLLQDWFVRDVLTVQEFEGLLDVKMGLS